MKKTYLTPEALLLVVSDEDILSASPLTASSNLLGDDDGVLLSEMFKQS